MINPLRWFIALPIGIAASFAVHMLSVFGFSWGHGFEEVAALWNSSDMAGMPISGTYIIFVTRLAAAAALVVGTVWVIPSHNKKAGTTLAIVISVISLALLIFLIYQSFGVNLSIGFSVWYRNILEMVSIVIGSIIGAGIGSSFENDTKT